MLFMITGAGILRGSQQGGVVVRHSWSSKDVQAHHIQRGFSMGAAQGLHR